MNKKETELIFTETEFGPRLNTPDFPAVGVSLSDKWLLSILDKGIKDIPLREKNQNAMFHLTRSMCVHIMIESNLL